MKYAVALLFVMIPFVGFSQTPWVAPEEAKKSINPLKKEQLALGKGAQLYDLLCAVCHGETGQGDGVTLEYLNPKPANLTSAQVQQQTDGELYWKITTGRPPMQSYTNVLSKEEIWQVVGYLRTLKE